MLWKVENGQGETKAQIRIDGQKRDLPHRSEHSVGYYC